MRVSFQAIVSPSTDIYTESGVLLRCFSDCESGVSPPASREVLESLNELGDSARTSRLKLTLRIRSLRA